MPKTAKKIRRNVQYRFRGIDRSASKAVYALESGLALAKRNLKKCADKHTSSRIQEIYDQLSPRNRRQLVAWGELLLGKPKKS